jgi:hypothetical protein
MEGEEEEAGAAILGPAAALHSHAGAGAGAGGGGEEQPPQQPPVYCAVGVGREEDWKANLQWVLANVPRSRRLVLAHLRRPPSRINMSTCVASPSFFLLLLLLLLPPQPTNQQFNLFWTSQNQYLPFSSIYIYIFKQKKTIYFLLMLSPYKTYMHYCLHFGVGGYSEIAVSFLETKDFAAAPAAGLQHHGCL